MIARHIEDFLKGLAQQSGIETPTQEDLARLDRKRKKKGCNQEWESPSDPDARITKMKDGTTHLAHKAEHVDMETGAVIAVTLQAADQGDTTTLKTLGPTGETVAELAQREVEKAPEQDPQVHGNGMAEVVADKGYHSGPALVALEQAEVRSYIPQRGRRKWAGKEQEQKAVYDNRRRVRGRHGKQALKKRGELLERSFAHAYETGGMRRLHLRGRENVLKRLLIHIGGFNLSLIFRRMLGAGTPRGLQNLQARLSLALLRFQMALRMSLSAIQEQVGTSGPETGKIQRARTSGRRPRISGGYATGC